MVSRFEIKGGLLRGYRVTRFSGTHSKSLILQMGEVLNTSISEYQGLGVPVRNL